MAENNILTHKIVAQEAAAILMEESKFIKSINREREKEFNRDTRGYKAGESVDIRIQPRPVVTDGAIYQDADAKLNAQEQSVRLAINYEKHISLEFGARERTLELTKFKERFMRPKIRALATDIDAFALKLAMINTNNMVVRQDNEISALAEFGRARNKLALNMAPDGSRFTLLSSDYSSTIVDNSGTLFNPTAEIAKQYKEGYIGRARGFEFMESEHIYRLQNGNKVAGIAVNGADQSGSTLNIDGLTNGDTIKAGQVFTIPGVNKIHPITHQDYGVLEQFTVLEDFTAGGATGQIKIYPEITPKMLSGERQANPTVASSPANDAVLVFIGAADQFIDQALCYHKDAYTFASVPKIVLPGCDGYTFNTDSVALRFMSDGDIKNDQEIHRLDILAAAASVRGNHGCRVARLVPL